MTRDAAYFRRHAIASQARLYQEALDAYGRVCYVNGCGVDDPDMLTIAHTFNDGAAHRRAVAGKSPGSCLAALRDLRKSNWPKDRGIETECANHQLKSARQARRATRQT